ncbi:MAG: DUF104 domain-containing protein [Thermoprotei archaeon]|nr:MAG: DUF104 domain-containing protein [Thermoprotei archaeon]
MNRTVEAVYEKCVLRPLEKLNLPEGTRVRLRVEGIYGLLKDWRIDPQKLKDELRKLQG